MYKSEFRKIDPYDWFCGLGSHVLYVKVLLKAIINFCLLRHLSIETFTQWLTQSTSHSLIVTLNLKMCLFRSQLWLSQNFQLYILQLTLYLKMWPYVFLIDLIFQNCDFYFFITYFYIIATLYVSIVTLFPILWLYIPQLTLYSISLIWTSHNSLFFNCHYISQF